MKVYLGKPRYHWISPYTMIDYVFFWKPWSEAFKERYDPDIEDRPEWVESVADFLVPVSKGIQWVLDKIHPEVNIVKIDYYDTWSMDTTLSPIILKMLIQLKETKHGFGLIDDEDAPKHLRSIYALPKNSWEWDDNAEARYEWVLDEMIWAFTQLTDPKSDDKFYDHSDVDPNEKDFMKQIRQTKFNSEGYTAHQDRIQNGMCLFGKYFRTLWD